MPLQDITDFIDKKIDQNPNLVVFTFYEVRIKLDLTEEETDEFLRLSRTRLENLNYQVYFTGAKYMFNNEEKIVEDNELLVAIKIKEIDTAMKEYIVKYFRRL